jgi:hypothetical protein
MVLATSSLPIHQAIDSYVVSDGNVRGEEFKALACDQLHELSVCEAARQGN